ncbi:beta-1,4-endoglucanase [Aphelenchoides avenae]|nr:beta-1,4-endoglucanase [Aphelenchus avenae]
MYVQHFYSGSHRDSARSAYSNAAAKIPVFISEYGISNADGGSDGQIFPDETNKWFQLLDGNKASYLAWSIADKNEASSALKPGTSPSQVGNDAQLSASGAFLKKMILGKKLFTCSGALPPASPSPPSPPSAPSPPSPPSPPSSGGGSSTASVSVKSAQSWNGGGVANVIVTNNGDKPICGFTLQLTSGSIRAGEFWSLVSSDRKTFTNQYPINLSKGQSWPTGADTAGGTYDGAQPTFKVASTKAC